jgi:phage-related protein
MYRIIYADEASEQLNTLEKSYRNKALRAIEVFSELGSQAGNSKPLRDGLFEIKADKVRVYFKYFENKIIIVGIIVLKKTQKAPERYIEQALRNINKTIKELQNENA